MFLAFVTVLLMESLKVPYKYYDGRLEGKVGRTRRGFYSTVDGRRATQPVEKILHMDNPGIRHGDEVLFFAKEPEEKIVLDENSSPDDLRKASIKILIRIMNASDKDSATISAIKELLDRLDADEKRNGKGNNTPDIRTVMSLLTPEQLDILERASG